MQTGCDPGYPDVRVGSPRTFVEIEIESVSSDDYWGDIGNGKVTIHLDSGNRVSGNTTMSFGTPPTSRALACFPNSEPKHFVVPFLCKRKTAAYQEDIRSQFAMQVVPNMQHLAAKLSRISSPSFPGHARYRETCEKILGFMVTGVPSESGQRPGVYLPSKETIPIEQMGEGVPNIVSLLADLAQSKGKLFVIEEPENDLHPHALKALLDLIVESSNSNQFVVSTHSNIVLRHLGAISESRVYSVTALRGTLPTEAKVTEVEPTPQARIEVLRDLGYSFSDFDLWDGWLILEESSAERIIRDYLIPWFVPKLTRIRTLSSGGAGQVEPTFEDFNRLVRFTHLEQAYTNAAWVRVDGDSVGKEAVAKLQKKYPSWLSNRFQCYSQGQFEHYYPKKFKSRIETTLSVVEKQARREAKRSLLNEVRAWLDADAVRGKKTLSESAKEIIEDLKVIESQLTSPKI